MAEKPGSWVSVPTAFCLGLIMMAILMSTDAIRDRLSVAQRPPVSTAPTDLGARSWMQAAENSLQEFMQDRIPAVAAGVTFFALLALFPAISAFVSIYGLMADAGDASRAIQAMAGVLPGGAITVIGGELSRLTSTSHKALGVAFGISVVVSLWSANAGMKALIEGLNAAYEAPERRGFLKLTLLSLTLTFGIILVGMVALSLTEVGRFLPISPGAASWLAGLVGFCLAVLALSVLYRVGPSRPGADWRWITPGGLAAAAIGLAASALFSWYVAHFGHYDRTYGSLGAIVGFLTWIWISVMVLLLGAEFNRELEKKATSNNPAGSV